MGADLRHQVPPVDTLVPCMLSLLLAQVYHPPNPGEAGTGPSAYSVVADAAALRRLLPLLPAKDTILKVGTVQGRQG